MPYLGNVPAEAYSQMSYQDLTGGSGTSFTLDYPVGNENEIEVFVNNVRQEPTVAYTTAGTALTMTGTIAATDDFYVVFQGKAQQTIGIPEKQTNGTYLFGNAVTIDEDGATVLTVDRATSDGTIIDLQKDGTTVGGIGAKFSGRSYIASGSSSNTGVRFDTNFIAPSDATGANRDNAINLGSSGDRFKDLYLSGGAYLGGTGSANYLDDYEEGTFTPIYVSTGGGESVTYDNQAGAYTKIGRTVFFKIVLGTDAISGGSGTINLGGLPFTVVSGDNSSGYVGLMYSFSSSIAPAIWVVNGGSTTLTIYKNDNLANVWTWSNLATGGNSNRLYMVGSYNVS